MKTIIVLLCALSWHNAIFSMQPSEDAIIHQVKIKTCDTLLEALPAIKEELNKLVLLIFNHAPTATTKISTQNLNTYNSTYRLRAMSRLFHVADEPEPQGRLVLLKDCMTQFIPKILLEINQKRLFFINEGYAPEGINLLYSLFTAADKIAILESHPTYMALSTQQYSLENFTTYALIWINAICSVTQEELNKLSHGEPLE